MEENEVAKVGIQKNSAKTQDKAETPQFVNKANQISL